MLKKKIIIIFLVFLNTYFTHSQYQYVPFDMISTDDLVLEDIRYLSLYSGNSFLSFTPPLSPVEIRNFLESIDVTTLSPSAMETYQRIQKRINPSANISFSKGFFTSFLNINSILEGRFKFNSEISEYPQNPYISPVVSIPLRVFFANSMQLYVEPSVTKRPDKYDLEIFDLNIPVNYFEYDESMPLKFFAAAGGNWWNFRIGRDRLFWGTAHSGSLTFFDNSQYFDFMRLSLFSSVFKYSMIVNQLPLNLNRNLFDPDNENISTWWEDTANRSRSIHRYYYLQRIDVKLFNRISIGLMEGVMVGNSPLELRYLNPLRIFHSLFSWEDYDTWQPPPLYENIKHGDMVGSILSLEINWNIIKNLSLYGQFVMNEFAEKGEKQRNPNQPPNGMGYLAGLQYAFPFYTWTSIFFLEFIYTDPYLNILSSPYGSFIQQNRYEQFYYLGYPRDTLSLVFGANLFKNDNINLSGVFSWISSGEHNKHGLIWDWERTSRAFNETTPSGTAENKFIISLKAGLKPMSWMSIKASVAGIISLNNQHISGNSQTGGQASISVGFHY